VVTSLARQSEQADATAISPTGLARSLPDDTTSKVGLVELGDVVFEGETKIGRDRPGHSFRRSEKMWIHLQVSGHSLLPDKQMQVEWVVVEDRTNQTMFKFSEDVTNGSIEKLLPLSSFKPGQYTLHLR